MNRKNIVPLARPAAPRPFETLGRVFEDLFDFPQAGGASSPRMDLKETDKAIEVSVALPEGEARRPRSGEAKPGKIKRD